MKGKGEAPGKGPSEELTAISEVSSINKGGGQCGQYESAIASVYGKGKMMKLNLPVKICEKLREAGVHKVQLISAPGRGLIALVPLTDRELNALYKEAEELEELVE